jgi:hypothetical protein
VSTELEHVMLTTDEARALTREIRNGVENVKVMSSMPSRQGCPARLRSRTDATSRPRSAAPARETRRAAD